MMYTKYEQLEIANNLKSLSDEVMNYDPIMGDTMVQAYTTIVDCLEYQADLEMVSQQMHFLIHDLIENLDAGVTDMYPDINRVLNAYEQVTNMVTFGSA